MSERFGSRFDPSELSDGGLEQDPAGIVVLARELERLGSEPVSPSVGFADRVMAAVEAQPDPAPVAAAARAIRQGRPAGLVAALGDAWRVALGGGRPLVVRAQAAALVVAAALGSVSLTGAAVVGAASVLAPEPSAPPIVSPSPSPSPSPSLTPSPSPAPSESSEDATSPTASEDPSEDPSEAASETPEHTSTPEATSTPERSTERPTATPEPTHSSEPGQSPEGTHSPEPTSSGESATGS
ncbi:MAG TPA: hypothetical protein VEY67_06850 [Candidatus Dormibacteraeota bacterium]|nr:hypothetical protein [Candidatus Dormibacteraeota bacterium]